MIPSSHIITLALIQFVLGLLGLLLRRAGTVVVVSSMLLCQGVLWAFCARSFKPGAGFQGLVIISMGVGVAIVVVGAVVLYAYHRFRKTVDIEEQDRMRH